MTQQPPSFETYAALPQEIIAADAPATIVYASSGTRRRAALEGHSPTSDSYMEWTRPRFLQTLDRLFGYGVQHVIVPTIGPRQVREGGVYQQRLVDWTIAFMAGEQMLQDYAERGWRVRFMHTPASLPALQEAGRLLEASTARDSKHTLWCYIASEIDDPWNDILAATLRARPANHAELIAALYGEQIPPVSMLLGSGQFVIRAGMLPPALLSPDLHFYWTERVGFELTDSMIRRIWYDYTYSRRTFKNGGGERYQSIEQYRSLWDTTAVIGVGQQHGGFWYPETFPGLPPLEPHISQEPGS